MSDLSTTTAPSQDDYDAQAKSDMRNSLIRMPDGTYHLDSVLFNSFDARGQAMLIDVLDEANRDAAAQRIEQAEVSRRLAEAQAGAVIAPHRTMLEVLEESLDTARSQLDEVRAIHAEVRAIHTEVRTRRAEWPGHG